MITSKCIERTDEILSTTFLAMEDERADERTTKRHELRMPTKASLDRKSFSAHSSFCFCLALALCFERSSGTVALEVEARIKSQVKSVNSESEKGNRKKKISCINWFNLPFTISNSWKDANKQKTFITMQQPLKRYTQCGNLTLMFAVFVVLFSLSSTALTTFGINKPQNQPAAPTQARN